MFKEGTEPNALGDEPNGAPVINPDSLSNRAERLVVDFLKGSDIGFSSIELTSIFDRNDRNGIDAVAEITGGGKIAIDITFSGGEKLKEKEKRNLTTPCVFLHDENGKAVGDSIPRVLIKENSQVNWTTLAKEADERGGDLISAMGDAVAKRKKVDLLRQIVKQMTGLSRYDDEYRRKGRTALQIFQDKLEELAA